MWAAVLHGRRAGGVVGVSLVAVGVAAGFWVAWLSAFPMHERLEWMPQRWGRIEARWGSTGGVLGVALRHVDRAWGHHACVHGKRTLNEVMMTGPYSCYPFCGLTRGELAWLHRVGMRRGDLPAGRFDSWWEDLCLQAYAAGAIDADALRASLPEPVWELQWVEIDASDEMVISGWMDGSLWMAGTRVVSVERIGPGRARVRARLYEQRCRRGRLVTFDLPWEVEAVCDWRPQHREYTKRAKRWWAERRLAAR